ncbi:MAG TPA: glycosyltransferase, partial [Arenibaculum sp.]|nr:glycosyltransferase [Arenibaculum sp.]
MNVLMMTNTFTPFVGGVTRSVETFTQSFRQAGHRVLIVAPACDGAPEMETDVIRVPAVQNFNGTDFSVMLPIPGFLTAAVERFDPDVVHSHHPFLLGGTALRLARMRGLPLVFTHHTLYDRYTHYVPGDSSTLRRLAANLSTSYAAICDQVFAPSESVAEMLRMRGVTSPVDVVPTGVPVEMLRRGSGEGFRAAVGIPQDAFVIGHVGRLAREKNLGFLCEAVIRVLARRPDAHLLLVGTGPITGEFRMRMASAG